MASKTVPAAETAATTDRIQLAKDACGEAVILATLALRELKDGGPLSSWDLETKLRTLLARIRTVSDACLDALGDEAATTEIREIVMCELAETNHA